MAEKGTEDPTPKRRRDARKEGQVARSAELASWTLILVGTAIIPVLIGQVADGVYELTSSWSVVATETNSAFSARSAVGSALRLALTSSTAFAAVLAVVGAVITIAQVGFVGSGKAVKPKLNRINPIKGFQRLFSVRSLWQTFKQLTLVSVLTLVTWVSAMSLMRTLNSQSGRSVGDALGVVGSQVTGFVRLVAALGLAFAVGDYVFQRRQLTKDIKMTKQQVRDEFKQSEGDPLVRQRIKMLMRDTAQKRMMDEVPSASVVVVNPTHFAVALRYRPGTDQAPTVVASGVDHLARTIREVAASHGVPVVSAPPLARTLYRHCEVGQAIPGVLYQAVAQVLAVLARRRGMTVDGMAVDVDVPDITALRRGGIRTVATTDENGSRR